MQSIDKELQNLCNQNGYTILKNIGEGSFGIIYLANNKCQRLALKCIDKKKHIHLEKDLELKQIKTTYLNTECAIMERLKTQQNQNILKYYGFLESNNWKVLILQYCQSGTLKDEIEKKQKLSEQQSIDVLKQILKGFALLIKNKIIHRDIKSQNILVHEGVYKIADFGTSKFFNTHDIRLQGTTVGSRFAMAPQVFIGKYNNQADIWSLGVMYHEMITGYLPFFDFVNQSVVQRVHAKIQNFDYISQQSKQFLQKSLVINPDDRYKWIQIFKMYNQQTQLFSRRKQETLRNNNQLQIKKSQKQFCQKPSFVKQSKIQNRFSIQDQFSPQQIQKQKQAFNKISKQHSNKNNFLNQDKLSVFQKQEFVNFKLQEWQTQQQQLILQKQIKTKYQLKQSQKLIRQIQEQDKKYIQQQNKKQIKELQEIEKLAKKFQQQQKQQQRLYKQFYEQSRKKNNTIVKQKQQDLTLLQRNYSIIDQICTNLITPLNNSAIKYKSKLTKIRCYHFILMITSQAKKIINQNKHQFVNIKINQITSQRDNIIKKSGLLCSKILEFHSLYKGYLQQNIVNKLDSDQKNKNAVTKQQIKDLQQIFIPYTKCKQQTHIKKTVESFNYLYSLGTINDQSLTKVLIKMRQFMNLKYSKLISIR